MSTFDRNTFFGLASQRAETAPPESRPPLAWIDMSSWDDIAVPEREWLVRDRIPLRQPTLFSGEGAVGKSLVILHLLVSIALGRDWLGLVPEEGAAWYIGAEDEGRELHIRLSAIQKHYSVTYADLVAAGFRMLSLFGEDAVPESGEQPDSDLREITFKKNNYGPISDSLLLRYRDGLFLPERGMSTLEAAAAAEETADHLFLTLLKKFAEQGRNLSHKPQPANYAPRVFAAEPETKKLPRPKLALEQAMNRLFREGKIHVQTYSRHGYERLAAGPKQGGADPVQTPV
jgi:RecA-family ATPase